MTVVAAHDALRRSGQRKRRMRRRVSGAGAVVVASVLGLWLWRRPSAPSAVEDSTSPPPDTGAAVTTPQPVSSPTIIVPRSLAEPTIDSTVVIPPEAAPLVTGTSGPGDTATGKLRVRAIPGDALIAVDNETIGQGAVVDRAVLAGERHLRISAPGYAAFDTTIVVAAGETTRLSAIELKPLEP